MSKLRVGRCVVSWNTHLCMQSCDIQDHNKSTIIMMKTFVKSCGYLHVHLRLGKLEAQERHIPVHVV